MGAHDRGVHAHDPVDETGGIRVGEQAGEDLVPGAIHREPAVSLPDRLPGTEPLGQIPPRGTRAVPEDDALDHLPVIPPRTTPTRHPRHQRGQPLPLDI